MLAAMRRFHGGRRNANVAASLARPDVPTRVPTEAARRVVLGDARRGAVAPRRGGARVARELARLDECPHRR
eukprot:scaffold37117_cov19-Tisochrysis_lutea.AAC.3